MKHPNSDISYTEFDYAVDPSQRSGIADLNRPSVATGTPRLPPLPALTSIRALFALMVVFSHFAGYHSLAVPDWLSDVANIAVSWFFILSGFILAYNFPTLPSTGDKLKFFVSRFWRLFPVQALTIFISILLFSSSRGIALHYTADLFRSLLLIHTWEAIPFASQAFNVPAWSISVEWFFYLMFPLLIAQSWSIRTLITLMFLLVAAIWAQSLGCFTDQAHFQAAGDSFHPTCYQVILYWPPARLWEFTLGILLCSISGRLQNPARSSFFQMVLFAFAVVAFFKRGEIASYFYHGFFSSFFSSWLIAAAIGATLILALSVPGPISRALSFKALVFMGEISFSVYMTHMLILRLADTTQIGSTLPIWTQLLVALVVINAVSAIIFTTVERPSRLMLKTALKRS